MTDNILLNTTSTFAAYDLGGLLKNATSSIETWLGPIAILLGTIIIGWMMIRLGVRIMSTDPQMAKQKHPWSTLIVGFVVGGILIGTGAWGLFKNASEAAGQEIIKWGGGTIDISWLLTHL